MKVSKTIKLFIGGAFVRSESGRSFLLSSDEGTDTRVCLASRKDFRNSVEFAKKGFKSWQKLTPFVRSQILYRMAEMLEGKHQEFAQIIQSYGLNAEKAHAEVEEAIDLLVYYAGFCDKFQQLGGTVNSVNGPYQHVSTPEALGICGVITATNSSLSELCGCIAALLAGGNSIICLLGPSLSPLLAILGEVFHTSDLPDGCVNLLSGKLDELGDVIAGHRELRAIACLEKDHQILLKIRELAADNLKQVLPYHPAKSLENTLNYVGYKSVWHPQGY